MRELKMCCSAAAADTIDIFRIDNTGVMQIDIEQYQMEKASVQLTKIKAKQLRDWLNEFLGESNLNLAAPDMYDMLASIENDGNQVPAFLWDKIQATLAKARGEPK